MYPGEYVCMPVKVTRKRIQFGFVGDDPCVGHRFSFSGITCNGLAIQKTIRATDIERYKNWYIVSCTFCHLTKSSVSRLRLRFREVNPCVGAFMSS